MGKRNGRVNVAEEDARSLMIEVVAKEAKLAFGKNGFRMRTGRRLKLTALHVSSNAEDMLQILYFSSKSCSLLALQGFREEERIGRGEGVGSVGAADMARGVGNGLGEVGACGGLRVISMMIAFMPCDSSYSQSHCFSLQEASRIVRDARRTSHCRKHLGLCVMLRCTSAFLRYLKGPYLRAALASAGMSVDDVPTCRLRARLYGEGCCFLCNYFVIAQLFTIHS